MNVEGNGLELQTERDISTYSQWSTFRDCRRKAYWRYVEWLTPKAVPAALHMGAAVHSGLKVWYDTGSLAEVEQCLRVAYPDHTAHEDQHHDFQVASAMLAAYAERYPTEDFQVVALERAFEGTIENPKTSGRSLTFKIAGKVDGLVRLGGGLWLLEHKTASRIDEGYIDRLWGDFQTTLYAHYLAREMKEPVVGVLYNILGKPLLRQRSGETEDEFRVRYAESCARNKSGKSTAKRQMPETDEEFQARLREWYRGGSEPSGEATKAFERVELFISPDQIATLREELWELTQSWLDARRRGVWYQNTSFCWHWGRPCAYWPLCRSGGSELVKANDYERVEPHQELKETEDVPF